MARYECNRCEEVLNTTMPPHLCRDVAARLKEAERRANIQCRGTGSLEGYLTRMAHEEPHVRAPKGPFVDYVIDGHGKYLDPASTELDPPARMMLASRDRGPRSGRGVDSHETMGSNSGQSGR